MWSTVPPIAACSRGELQQAGYGIDLAFIEARQGGGVCVPHFGSGFDRARWTPEIIDGIYFAADGHSQ